MWLPDSLEISLILINYQSYRVRNPLKTVENNDTLDNVLIDREKNQDSHIQNTFVIDYFSYC